MGRVCAAGTRTVDGWTSRGRRRHAPRRRLKRLAGRRPPTGRRLASRWGWTAMPPACPLGAPSPPPPRFGGRSEARAVVPPPSQCLPPRRGGWRGGGCSPPAPSRPSPTRAPPRGREPHDRPTATRRVGSHVACARCCGNAPARAAGEDGRPGGGKRAAQQVGWRAVSKPPSPRQWSAGSPSPPHSAKPPHTVRWTWPHARPACACRQPAGQHLRAHTPRPTWGRV